MSATKEFLFDVADYVWLIEFAGLTFGERGKAIELYHKFLTDKFGDLAYSPDMAGWFDNAYEMVEEHDGADYARGKHKERLLGMVHAGDVEGQLEGASHGN